MNGILVVIYSLLSGTQIIQCANAAALNSDVPSPNPPESVLPNISVVFNPPVVVPAMAVSDLITATTFMPTETNEIVAPLEGSVFNAGSALINGTPVFVHTPKDLQNLSSNNSNHHSEDHKSVIHSVMKAVEHLNNLSAQNNTSKEQPLLPSAGEPPRKSLFDQVNQQLTFSQNATSSVKVVVVPLVQNAYDLNEHNNSAASMAASNPIVVSKQTGNETLIHVIVKREDGVKFPISEHNSHGPLTDEDFTPSTAPPQSLSTSSIIILEEIKNDSGVSSANTFNSGESNNQPKRMMVSTAELLTAHSMPANGTKHPDAVPFVKAEPIQANSPQPNGTVMFVPSVLIPILPPIVKSIEQNQMVHEQRPHLNLGNSPPQTLDSILDVSTLPSAPRSPLEINEPMNLKPPLPAGTFSFLPDHPNSTSVLTAEN